ncbi:MAG: spore gernimation protein [Bacillus thermozeamaize]|uniref:Spore gernimation protein n=1 Tax=Bacillus thermozeamaize TaxID=230954 RepID=A0A1Y3PME9_9BACI|nr:MAG: spore gernimation protein [Bacillus thermozeamaize]
MRRRNDRQQKWSQLLRDVQAALGSPADLVFRAVLAKEDYTVHCMYLESLADKTTIDDYIMKSLMGGIFTEVEQPHVDGNRFVRALPFSSTSPEALLEHTVDALLMGQCALVDFHADRICFINVVSPKHRQIEEPKSESTVRGPQEGFTEHIETNVGLIRKRLRNPHLRFEKMIIGNQTRTTVMLVYVVHVAPDALIMEARRRLQAIQTDSVLESTFIEEYIQDRMWSLFPTLNNTEKPDVVVAQLLEGKVAVMVDGTPNALIAPMTFFEFFTSPEDYYQRADIATFIRWMRLFSFLIAVFVPSMYVAVTTFHQELLPTQLLINLSAQREGVPFPSLTEVLLMEVVFEIIREAGLRMPRALGQALSIVGAIVLGQAAVDAGLISAAIVIVVAITGITNIAVPTYSFGISQRLIRFSFVLLAGFMGLVGILCGLLFLIAHLASLKSFGEPYLKPVAPVNVTDLREVFVRLPRPMMKPKRLPKNMKSLIRKK